ncbi:CAF17-like 4Fe-4S cluster assembly/insertion protein YgfZ [Roseicitreum antarcticum]|uniref:CAF17 C-terminal domain-containing protein n=1 Tax=Roseicitreum antarcticum TaxID=564137 RepID=A0A1H2RCL0_9RHOB|nr:folate-binding protein YgfZ [Roseicitreum antarcticum]SDW16900.1 hypothetical protein SAMN04488238_101260 [Roseicitreum antarcticum]
MRKILKIEGEEARDFLQGLVSNDLRRLDTDGIVYAALLTPQGKYLADFFVLRGADALLVDVDAALAEDLLRRLTLYRMRKKVVISETDMTVARGTGTPPDGALSDPRHPAMGWRLYGAAGDDGTDWDALRVAHCIPQSGVELIPNETFLLEAGFDRLNGVDFRKGCYVGQEVTARMRHKTELRKGFVRVEVTGDAGPGTAITSGEKPAGTLLTRSGDAAIAYLRFDRAGDEMQAGDARVVWPDAP